MSKVTYTFYTSRNAAWAVALRTGLKFKDHGPDAPAGERWSTYAPGTTRTRTPRANSKKSRALEIMRQMFANNASRQEVLARLVAEADLTPSGASTYYAGVKSGAWSL